MYRGTTPTLRFTLPIDTAEITQLSIAFKQAGVVVFEKTMEDVSLSGDTVVCTLSEEETLSLRGGTVYPLRIQLRVGAGGARLASQVFEIPVEQILRDGAL